MYTVIKVLLLIITSIGPKCSVFGISRNATISQRSSDSFYGSTNGLDRQYPMDLSFLLPHLIVGVFIPIAVIIGIGVVLMKLFIIGFMLLGRGGLGFGQSAAGYYPWRADQQQQHTSRSLYNNEGSLIPSYLSSTLWTLIEKVSKSMEKYEKYKI